MNSLYGIDIRDRMIRQALFVCPRCGLDRDGTEFEPRRWVTVFGLPVVPLRSMEHQLSCNVCDHRSDLGALDIPTTEVLAGYLADATRHGVVAVVRSGRHADGSIDEHVRRLAVDTMLSDGFRYDDAKLDGDLVGLDDESTRQSLSRLAEEMTAYGKQAFLHRMAAIAIADGPAIESERQTLIAIGAALGMPAMQINDVITVADLAAA